MRSHNVPVPGDTDQLARRIVDIATGEVEDKSKDDGKKPASVELGRLIGTQIAKKAAKSRWESK